MKTRIFQSVDEWNSLERGWAELLQRSYAHSPFLDPRYQRLWWSTLGGGEWAEADMWVFAGYDDSQQLIGIAPLFLSQDESQITLRLIGSKEVSDYLDFIVVDEWTESFALEIVRHLEGGEAKGCRRMVLDNILEGSPTIPALESATKAHGWKFSIERGEPSPLLMLPPTFDEYLEQLGSKQRRELKRKMRRAAEYPAPVNWRLTDQVEDDIEIFLALMQNDPAKREFLTEPMMSHFRNLAVGGSQAGMVQLALLEVSGVPVFGYLNFIDSRRLWVYNSGFDPNHSALSPGWVLMGHLIEWAIGQGLDAVDFMRGDEEYKYRLGGIDRFVTRLVIEP